MFIIPHVSERLPVKKGLVTKMLFTLEPSLLRTLEECTLSMKRSGVIAAPLLLVLLLLSTIPLRDVKAETDEVTIVQTGSKVENSPSLVRLENGTYLMAYESGQNVRGLFSINLTWSEDGSDWSSSWEAFPLQSLMGNRHPSLVLLDDGTLMMAYYSDRTLPSDYKIYLATSQDGREWTETDPLDIPGPSINPHLGIGDNGEIAISYQVYSPVPLPGGSTPGSYFVRSLDIGSTWEDPVFVSLYNLPRLLIRSDGSFFMTFQGGSTGDFNIRYSSSEDGIHWEEVETLTNTGNSHDSKPLEMMDGTTAVFFISSINNQPYDVYVKTSKNMIEWSDDLTVYDENPYSDVKPEAVEVSEGLFLLSWGYNLDQDQRDTDIAVGVYELEVPQEEPPVIEEPPEEPIEPVILYPPVEKTSGSLYVEWSEYGSDDFDRYELFMIEEEDDPELITSILKVDETKFLIEDLSADTSYTLFIRTYIGIGDFADSNRISARTLKEPVPEPEPEIPDDEDDDPGSDVVVEPPDGGPEDSDEENLDQESGSSDHIPIAVIVVLLSLFIGAIILFISTRRKL